ncbi:OmpA family protein [bacterium]|nr:OmpA family protein [bacterium]
MRNDYYSNSKDYINRWVVSYADLVTMLLALFMVLFAISQNVTKYQAKIINENDLKIPENVAMANVEQLEELKTLFDENISQSDNIKFLKEGRGLVIRLNNRLLFDEGSAIIKKDALATVDEIIDTISKIDNNVIVEGHTDSTPINNAQFPSNWELSTARATNIIAYMLKSGKIKPKRLSAVGYGEYMPIADNTSNDGRLLNRRVDIIILKNK